MQRKTICLNMIVKNEALVIRRCLSTVRHLIDSWAIVDTGSTDGTQDIIRAELAGIPGELFERPWKNFGYNRTEARELAQGRGDYLLLMDADDQLETSPGFEMPALDRQAYESAVLYGGLLFYRINVIDSRLPWRWVGVLHEYLACDVEFTRGRLEGIKTRIIGGGARSQVDAREKFLRDAAVLEEALRDEPTNARYAFYLAQSYRDAGENERALAAYDRRATMGGFDQEVFRAQLEAGRLAARLERPAAEVIERYLRAWEYRPARAEPLGELAAYLRTHGDRWQLARMFAKRASEIPLSTDSLFVEPSWYEWRALDECAIAAYWLGDYRECQRVCEGLLDKPALPEEQRERIMANLNFARSKLGLPELPKLAGPEGVTAPLPATLPKRLAKSQRARAVAPERYPGCPLCTSKDEKPLKALRPSRDDDAGELRQPRAEWLRCEKCGHAHTRGFWPAAEQASLWERRLGAAPDATAADAERRRWAPAVQSALNALGGFEALVAQEPAWAWLDVLPRRPGLLSTARELGFRTTALVERAEPARAAFSGSELREGGWAALTQPPQAARYRVISLCDALSWHPAPLKALRSVREALEPGGACLLTCPNIDASSFALLDQQGDNPYWAEPGRQHLFSAARLIDLLNALEMPVVHLDVGAEEPAELQLVARKLGHDPGA